MNGGPIGYVCTVCILCVYVCMYVCMYVCINEWRSDRVLVRLGLDTLIGWLQLDMYVCTYVCMYSMYVTMYVYVCMYI